MVFRFLNKKNLAVERAFEKLDAIRKDDDAQIRVLGEEQYRAFKEMPLGNDTLFSQEAFGRNINNPSPTNGPIGTIAYLSNVVNMFGSRMFFHRVASQAETVDIYEFVSWDSLEWGFFHVNMYHSAKTTFPPKNFLMSTTPQFFSGFNHRCENFPYDYEEQLQVMPQYLRLVYERPATVKAVLSERPFSRPKKHAWIEQHLSGRV